MSRRGTEVAHLGWWDVHDASVQRARALFAIAVSVVALYLVGLVTLIGSVTITLVDGTADRLGDGLDAIGVTTVVAVGLGAFLLASVIVAVLGWRGLPHRTLRASGARPPANAEADRAALAASAFALSYGLRAPRVWVIDDPAVNALAFGRPGNANICVTSGALLLPDDELEALTGSEVAALASHVFAYSTAAADLVLLGEWCTRLLWSASAFVILALAVGLPLDAAAAYVVGIALLVVVTRPVLFLADRGLVHLLDETSELIDLEVVRRTDRPGALARLLLDMLQQPGRASSRWEIVHLWFEREVVEAVGRRPAVYRQLAAFGAGDLTVPAFVERCALRGRAGLVHRAEIAVELADDDRLRQRLALARDAVRS